MNDESWMSHFDLSVSDRSSFFVRCSSFVLSFNLDFRSFYPSLFTIHKGDK
jgi:hypothetical protein